MLRSSGDMGSYEILHHWVSHNTVELSGPTSLQGELIFLITSPDESILVRVSEELKTLLLKMSQARVAHLSDSTFPNTDDILDSVFDS